MVLSKYYTGGKSWEETLRDLKYLFEQLWEVDKLDWRVSKLEPSGAQVGSDGPGVQPRVEHESDVSGKERPGGGPVDPIVVRDLADGRPLRRIGIVAPGRRIADAVRWVGHHEVR